MHITWVGRQVCSGMSYKPRNLPPALTDDQITVSSAFKDRRPFRKKSQHNLTLKNAGYLKDKEREGEGEREGKTKREGGRSSIAGLLHKCLQQQVLDQIRANLNLDLPHGRWNPKPPNDASQDMYE